MKTNYVYLYDALEFLTWIPGRADLILTDPPHLDQFGDGKTFGLDAEAHKEFAHEWVPSALKALTQRGALIHSCGAEPVELDNYLSGPTPPGQVWVWRHQTGHHFFLAYGLDTQRAFPILDYEKPDPLWRNLVGYCPSRGLIVDPFCGRGEVLRAVGEREYIGVDWDEDAVKACRASWL